MPPSKMPVVKYGATTWKIEGGEDDTGLDVACLPLLDPNAEETVEWKKPEMPSTRPNLERSVCKDAAIINPPARL